MGLEKGRTVEDIKKYDVTTEPTKGQSQAPKNGSLPQKSEKMKSHQITLKIGRETKFGMRNSKIRVLTRENNRKLGIRPPK